MLFSSWAGSGNLIGDDVESFLAEEKAAFLTGPGMFSTTDDSLLHSGVRLKSVELIAIPFHTWKQEFTKVRVKYCHLEASVKNDRQEGNTENIEEVEDAEEPHVLITQL